jgi:spermidine/putrescine transport system permease protein
MIPLFRWGLFGAVFVYLYAPVLVLIVNSVNQSRYGLEWAGFSWQWYEKLFSNASLLAAAGNSLTIAILSATAAAIIGTLTATALYRYQFRGKKTVSFMLFTHMLTPDIVMAIALLSVFILIGMQLGFWSLLIAHITFCLPYVVTTVFARLNGSDPRILEAARDLGASEAQVFWRIVVPMALPAILSGWLLSFTLSLDDVIVSTFVTGPSYEILPIRVYSMVKVGVSPEINALATVLLIFSLTMVAISQLLIRKDSSK